MAKSTPNQYPVVLSNEQRQKFSDITRNGHAPAKKIRHAQLLLLSDHDREGGPLTRTQIAEVLQMHPNTVDKIRQKFVLDGEAPALNRKPRKTPPTPPIFDGHSEAQLVAICCSDPPEGRVCWTMQLLAGSRSSLSSDALLAQSFFSASSALSAFQKSPPPGRDKNGIETTTN